MEAGEWEDSRGRRGLTQVPSEAVMGGNDSPHMLSNGERKKEDSYRLSNRLVLVVRRRDGPGRGFPVFGVALIVSSAWTAPACF